MATRIDSVAARAKLLARRDPYWQRLDVGSYLGDRKMTADSAGSWVARAVDRATGKKPTYELGQFTELPAHARFGAASKAARERFEHLGRGGSASPSTVRQVCARYVDSQREKLGEKAAKDAQARFANYVLNDQRLANLEVTKLSPRMCRAGSRACARSSSWACHPIVDWCQRPGETHRVRFCALLVGWQGAYPLGRSQVGPRQRRA